MLTKVNDIVEHASVYFLMHGNKISDHTMHW